MKRNFFIALVLGVSLMACSKSYYPQMYEKAGEDEKENVFIGDENQVLLDAPADTVISKEEVAIPDTIKPEVKDSLIQSDTVVVDSAQINLEKIKESTDKYVTDSGEEVVYAYHVVVGSFSQRDNATKLSIDLNKSGVKATVAVNQNGLYRVFYYSTDNEPEVRQVLAKARKKYPDAWMLKLVAK